MAKNTNKTEHVLKLIAGGGEAQEPVPEKKAAKNKTGAAQERKSEPRPARSNTAKPPEAAEPAPVQEQSYNYDENHIVVKNVVEGFVEDKLIEVLGRIKCCTCESCVNDIKAIALNSLQPKYIATRRGELFSKAAACYTQYEADVTAAITRAAIVVSTRPRHI